MLGCLVVIMICVACFSPNEKFIVDGLCDCCKCGFISCQDCETRKTECCGNSFGFDRYSFT